MAPKTDPFGIVRPLGHSRRALMLGGGAACVTGLLRINLPGRAQSAACGRVVVGTWGGDYANFLDTYLHHELQSGAGLEVTTDLGPASPRKSKLLAERNRPQGSVDIVCLDQTDMYQMARQGVLQDLSSGDVPNAARVIEPLRKAYSVPHVYSARVIVYNPEKMPKPGSYRDLWHPDCAGKIGFADLLAVSVLESAALAWGGGPSDYEPGKAKLLELKKTGVRLYPSNEALAAALKFGEIWATVMWRARAYQWRRAGIAVESAVPEEGATPITFEAGLAKNAPSARCAMRYLNRMLDPVAQVGFAQSMGYLPTVADAVLPEDLRKELDFTAEERARFVRQDLQYLDQNASTFKDWWDKEFKT